MVYSQQHQSVKRLYWVGYYRKFIKGYGSIYKLLNKLLKKDIFEWEDEATAALKPLNEVMTKPLVIVLLDLNKLFVVESDASVVGIEAILMQEASYNSYYQVVWWKAINIIYLWNRNVGHPLIYGEIEALPLKQTLQD